MTDILSVEPSPGNTNIPNLLHYQQGNDVAAPPEGYEALTNPLNPLLRSGSRLAHFTDGVYDLGAESHLMRLLKTMLGESGIGGIQRSLLMARLQQSLGGTHFFDLDAFYGAIFGARRRVGELLTANPYVDVVPPSEWDELRRRDGAYRARVSRLSSAIHLGATPAGIEAVAEALTGVEFDLVESWQYGSYKQYTWDDWESFSWTQMEAYSWDELEFGSGGSMESPRNVITLYPHEPLSDGERFDLERALDRIKPAHMLVIVSDEPIDIEINSIPFFPSSTSEKWEIRQLVQNARINGILPYPDYAEDEFIEPPQSAFGGYSGEAWTALDRSPRVLAYSTPTDVALNLQVDTAATDMPPQPLLTESGTAKAVSLPEYGLRPIQGLYAGRSVSDGIVASNPFEYRSGAQSGVLVDRIPSEYVSESLVSTTKIGQRFWTTPVRDPDSSTSEVLEVRFNEPVSINHISFEYARFPCTIVVQVWDRGVGSWVTINTTTTRDSSPYGIGNTPPADAQHPYHWGTEHWAQASVSMDPVSSRYFRFVLKRIVAPGPVGISGTRIAYPLGLRNIDLGYRVNAVSKVPHVPAISPVASQRNILGLQSRYYLHRDRALAVADADPTSAWICEPQPIADAVVNLYLNLSDDGIPRVVNQIFVDPVYSGVVCNLYYTSRLPDGNAFGDPADDVITPLITGSPNPTVGSGLRFDPAPSGAATVVTPLGGDSLAGAWWMGIEWRPLEGDVAGNRLRPIVASTLSGIPFFLSHVISSTNDAYIVFLSVRGKVVRVVFEEYLPAPNHVVRALIGVSPTGMPTLIVEANGVRQSSTQWDPSLHDAPYDEALDLDVFSGARFDPQRYEYPEGANLLRLRSGSLHFSASDHTPALEAQIWRNRGADGNASSIVAPWPHKQVSGPVIHLPGTTDNYLEVEDFAGAHQTGDLAMTAKLSLDQWFIPDDTYGLSLSIVSPNVSPTPVVLGTITDPSAGITFRYRKVGGDDIGGVLKIGADTVGSFWFEEDALYRGAVDGEWVERTISLSQRYAVGENITAVIDIEDGVVSRVDFDLELRRVGPTRYIASRWDPAGDQASWRWGIDGDGYMIFENSDDGTTSNVLTYRTTSPLELSDGDTAYVGVRNNIDYLGDSNVRFYVSADGNRWSEIDLIYVNPTYTRHDGTAPLRIGAIGGTSVNIRGCIEEFRLYGGIIEIDEESDEIYALDDPIGSPLVFALTPDDYLSPWDWSGADPTFETASGPTVTVKRSSGAGGTIASNSVSKVIHHDSFIEMQGAEILGSTGLNSTISLPDQHRSINLVFEGIIEQVSAAATFLPIVTKKATEASASRGWGIYIEDNKFHLLVSDGGTQEDVVLTMTGTADDLRGRHVVMAVVTDEDGNLNFTVRLRDHSPLVGTLDVADFPVGSISNTQPVRIFADSDSTTIGCLSLFALDVDPSRSLYASTIAANVFLGTDVAGVGSNWIASSEGAFEGISLRAGDGLFIVPVSAMPADGSTAESMQDTSYMHVSAGSISFGAQGGIGSNIVMTQMAVGYGSPPASFLDDPTPYCLIPVSNTHTAFGTFLRYHFDYIGWTDGDTPSIGFMGGAPDAWSTAEWTPIGQFPLTRGVVGFPDVAAIALKLEMTGLVAEPYEAFIPVNKTVNRFAATPVEAQGRARDSVSQTVIELLTPNRFPDAVRGVFYGQDDRINYVSPTSGITVIDGAMRDQIGQRFGFGYSMTAWQPKYRAPINQVAGVHTYNVTEVTAMSRTAFFAGIRTLDVRRVVRLGRSDTKVYDDTLLDAQHIDLARTTLEVEPGQMYTPEADASSIMDSPREGYSKPFYSRRPVTALQFSTQQTGPIQVVPDDEFRSPALISYDFTNTSQWHKSGDSIIFWDANLGGVRVSRDPSILDAFYAPDTPIVHPPVSPVLASGFGRLVQIDFDSFGGISSPLLTISPRGILFAGARVSAVSELQADLYLRIYGSDGTTVLAERAFRPKVDSPTECVLPYVIGNTPTLDEGVQIRVEQDGPYMDSWLMHALSAFDTSILWEFSVDDGASWIPGYTARGLRYGVVDFPHPGTALRWRVVAYRHNSVVDAIRIRPWYMNRMGAAL